MRNGFGWTGWPAGSAERQTVGLAFIPEKRIHFQMKTWSEVPSIAPRLCVCHSGLRGCRGYFQLRQIRRRLGESRCARADANTWLRTQLLHKRTRRVFASSSGLQEEESLQLAGCWGPRSQGPPFCHERERPGTRRPQAQGEFASLRLGRVRGGCSGKLRGNRRPCAPLRAPDSAEEMRKIPARRWAPRRSAAAPSPAPGLPEIRHRCGGVRAAGALSR